MIAVIVIVAVLVAVSIWIVRVAGWRFALQRLGGALLILVIVTFITSLLLRQVGVEESQREALRELGLPDNAQPCVASLGTGVSNDEVLKCMSDRGLNKSLVGQYAQWSGNLVTGDLGIASYKNNEKLTSILKQRAPKTAWLFLYSQAIALTIAVPLGIWSAYHARRRSRTVPRWVLPVAVAVMIVGGLALGWGAAALLLFAIVVPIVIYHAIRGGPGGDTTVNTFAFVVLSVPAFVLAETLRYVFAVKRDWYQLTSYKSWGEGVGAHLGSVWLPALVLGLVASPVYLRLLRADMIQNLQQDFVAVAKAKGMSNVHILLRHVLRPSTVTLLTVAGLNIAQLVNGAIVVEFIFDYDGMGSYLIDAVSAREFFAVQTIVALVAILFVLANTVVDMLYTVIDPRVRTASPT